jgi:ABC-type multidrug transport system fused ATPase/permease subunit
MTDFFYALPIWLSTLLVLGVSLAIGLGSSLGVRLLFRLKPSAEEKEVGINLMQVVAAYIGILLAFAGVVVWQAFGDAETAVHQEAASAAQLYRDLTTYGPETLTARADLRAYVESIVNDEWPLLKHGEVSMKTEVALARLFEGIGEIRPPDNRDSAIYAEAFSNLNDLVAHRRDRLTHSQSGIPILLWITGLVGSLFVIAYASVFTPTRLNIIMISGVSITLGLVFLFILTVDRPFKGQFSVSSRELAELFPKFDMLDRMARHSPRTP